MRRCRHIAFGIEEKIGGGAGSMMTEFAAELEVLAVRCNLVSKCAHPIFSFPSILSLIAWVPGQPFHRVR